MNNNIVTANFNSNTNSYTSKKLKAVNNLVNVDLYETNIKAKTGDKLVSDVLTNADLTEYEYSLEELLAEAKKTRIENQKELAEELERQRQANIQAVNEFANELTGLDFNDPNDVKKARKLFDGLTEDQKELLNPEFEKNLKKIEEAHKKAEEERKRVELERQKKLEELEELYNQRDENNGLFHPKIEANIESKIEKLEKELGVPHKPDGWESFCDTVSDVGATAVTFVASTVEGFLDVGEGVVDGLIYGTAKTLQVFGVDDKWSEDIISYDVSGNLYDGFVDIAGIDEDIAYGWAHDAGNFGGEMVGYYTLSAVPYVGPALSCIGGAGKSVEESINRQLAETGTVNDWIVFGESALGALEGFGFSKASKGAQAGINALKEVGVKQTFKNIVGGITKDGLKQTLKNSGKLALNAVGQTLTDSDTYIETVSVLGNDVISGLSTGEWDFKRMAGETLTVLGENYVGNLLFGAAGDTIKNSKNIKLEASTFDRIKNKMYLKNQGNASNDYAFEIYKKSISDAIEQARTSGNKDIQNMLERLYILKKDRPDFTINFDPNNGAFSDAYGSGSISLGTDVLLGNRKGVVYHELGHTLHGVVNNSQVPTNYMNVKQNVYNHMSNNTEYVKQCMDYFQNSQNNAYTEATKYFDETLSNNVVSKLNSADWNEVANNYRNVGFSEDQIKSLIQTDFNTQYNNIRTSEISRIADDYQREWGVDAASDIVGSVFNGNKRFAILDNNGNKVYLGGDITYSHSQDYYLNNTYTDGSVLPKTLNETNEASFHEQIANYIQLKLSGNQSTIDMLHGLLGDEWYYMMEDSFKNITDYFK